MNSCASLLAYETIRKKILHNQLDSRKFLDEKLFSKELKMSRTPIHEALIMIEKEGLVTRDEGKGFHIRRFSIKDIQDIYDFRDLVEVAIVHPILAKVTEGKIENLAKILKQMKALIGKGHPAEALVISLDFHAKVIEISENSLVIEAMKHCYEKIIMIGWAAKEMASTIQSWKEHKDILNSLKERNSRKLKAKIHTHILNARDRSLDIIRLESGKWFFHP